MRLGTCVDCAAAMETHGIPVARTDDDERRMVDEWGCTFHIKRIRIYPGSLSRVCLSFPSSPSWASNAVGSSCCLVDDKRVDWKDPTGSGLYRLLTCVVVFFLSIPLDMSVD